MPVVQWMNKFSTSLHISLVPVVQWIERNVADVEVGGSNPSGHAKEQHKMAEKVEKATYYFKHKKGEPDFYLLIRRISLGKNAISYQSIGEYSGQEKGSLRIMRKRVHRKRVMEMDRNVAAEYSLEAVSAMVAETFS